MKKEYSEMAGQIQIFNFDLVYTMAVLEHIHDESEFIFSHITRITRKILITIEDEGGISWRHFPRNYKKIFENLGMKQIEEINFKKTRVPGIKKEFFGRVFTK
jgi:hypothetical protein